MDTSEYTSMVVFCSNCQRTFCTPIKNNIDESINQLSKDGCIYCQNKAENKQLQILSLEKEQYDASLAELYVNLCKYVTFD